MSTTGVESWAVDLANVGAIYPFQGMEWIFVLIGVVFWIYWHVWCIRWEKGLPRGKDPRIRIARAHSESSRSRGIISGGLKAYRLLAAPSDFGAAAFLKAGLVIRRNRPSKFCRQRNLATQDRLCAGSQVSVLSSSARDRQSEAILFRAFAARNGVHYSVRSIAAIFSSLPNSRIAIGCDRGAPRSATAKQMRELP